jgi:AraC family transcriptional regulator of adaptative response/methylated-DNA-[protein]-cysteine methyltransferase
LNIVDHSFMSTNPQIALSAAPTASLDPESAWQRVIARDRAARFFYAVATTGVFCRPSCKSRRPLQSNVRFFGTVEEAQAAGFRPCKRCRPGTPASSSPLDEVRAYLERNLDRPVRLETLGRIAKLSPFTVQRLFKQEMGVSPLQYQKALRAGSLRSALRRGETVTNAIYEAGFGSSSRGYEGAQLGMTPARFAKGGKDEKIGWASGVSPFGWVIVGATERGLCWLSLAKTAAEAEETLRDEFPAAELRRDPALARMVDAAVAFVSGSKNSDQRAAAPQALQVLDLRGEQARAAGGLDELPGQPVGIVGGEESGDVWRCPVVGRCGQAEFRFSLLLKVAADEAGGVHAFGFDHAGVQRVDANLAGAELAGQSATVMESTAPLVAL